MQHTQALAEIPAGRKIFTQNIVYAREDTAIRSVSISHKRKKSANCLFFGRQTADFICSFAAIMKNFASQKENCTRLKHFFAHRSSNHFACFI